MATPTSNIFDKILADALRAGIAPAQTQKASKWFQDKVKEYAQAGASSVITQERLKAQWLHGKMYFFAYDPKWKKELPYYDRFPLIFPLDIERRSDRFLGMNLHYLPPLYRVRLMDALMAVRNNRKFDDSTKVLVTYKILSGAARYKLFKPCIKMYLNSHVRSRFVEIQSVEWNIAIFLPLEKFQKASRAQVWEDSLAMSNAQGKKFRGSASTATGKNNKTGSIKTKKGK